MEAKRVLLNPTTNKYYTGRFWDTPWSFNWEDAELFKDENEINELFNFDEDDNEAIRDIFEDVGYLEVRTFYVA